MPRQHPLSKKICIFFYFPAEKANALIAAVATAVTATVLQNEQRGSDLGAAASGNRGSISNGFGTTVELCHVKA